MIYAKSSADAFPNRFVMTSGTGNEHWRTDFIGLMSEAKTVKGKPQAFLIEMNENEVLAPHFHEIDQFQVFLGGTCNFGRNTEIVSPVTLHYADHHTGYGPITAGKQGLSYFTLRADTDPGAVYLHKEGYREKLKPSPHRHHMIHTTLSVEALMASRKQAVSESLIEKAQPADPGALLLRLGANMEIAVSDGVDTAGQYVLVLNGALVWQGKHYPPASVIFLDPGESGFELRAGSVGVEAMVLQYPMLA